MSHRRVDRTLSAALSGGSRQKYFSEEELASLIRSLDREEDQHIFATDVLQTYPYLTESYTKVCPVRIDLATAATRALEGSYVYDAKLSSLKDDVALMVSNCIAFNGATSAYADTARRFEEFANGRIDAFLLEKSGGRRPSLLRLSSTAATTSGKESGTASRSGSAVAIANKDVAVLVQSLDRREDGGAFTVDVTEAYPDLRESYVKLCPHPMNLAMMRKRAMDGYYTAAVAGSPVVGSSVALSMQRIREDVELMVHNCITFNATVSSWVALAHSFQKFAHRKIDDFVLRHSPHLRGTTMGAAAYVQVEREGSSAAPQRPAPPSTTPVAKQNIASVASGGSGGSSSSSPERRRTRLEGGRGDAVKSNDRGVTVVTEVVPQVSPTPLQPPVKIPSHLRRRVVLHHLSQSSLCLAMVGAKVELATLYPPVLSEGSSTTGAGAEAEVNGVEPSEPAASVPPTCNGASASPPLVSQPTSVMTTIPAECSAAAVLKAFRRSVHQFFDKQRRRIDFQDAFTYSVREERTYTAALDTIESQFNAVLQHVLLYEAEAADLLSWAALQSVEAAVSTTGGPPQKDSWMPPGGWLVVLHYQYLVRFLVHFPQLACLCSATVAPKQTPEQGGALRVSRDSLKVMAKVAAITEELLQYIEDFEIVVRDSISR